MPTYHLASCADDADLRISHIIRGQDHLTNTFKHVLIFEAAGVAPPQFAHLPLLVAPDGAKLSKRRHGPVVSVTTYRDAGFLPHAFVNFLCLLGWSPKDDREQMTRQELIDAVLVRRHQPSNAVVNFTEEDPFDPKAVWLNAEHIRALPVDQLASLLLPVVRAAGFDVDPPKWRGSRRWSASASTCCATCSRWPISSSSRSCALRPRRADPAKRRCRHGAARARTRAGGSGRRRIHARRPGSRPARRRPKLGIKAGQMFQPIRVAVCGRKTAPPLFGTLEALGREPAWSASTRPLKS